MSDKSADAHSKQEADDAELARFIAEDFDRLRNAAGRYRALAHAKGCAEDTILDQRIFVLSADDHERFLALLDNPPEPTEDARRRYQRKPAWEG